MPKPCKKAAPVPLLAAVCLVVLQLLFPPDPAAARGMSSIRDAEIEHTIRSWAKPLLEAADLVPGDVKIHIVSNPGVNAFVAGGQRIFLTTGLLMKAKHPGQVKGVLAHEIGHIKGGHLARLQGATEDARDMALIGAIFGVAIGTLAGRPDAGIAGAVKAMDIAGRSLLKFTRSQERSADQVAVDLLDRTKTSSRGLLELFQSLQNQELLSPERQDPYLRSHPLTRDRIVFIRNHLAQSPFAGANVAASDKTAHDRMVGKLEGFLNPPARTLRRHKPNDRSIRARYARAVALYRNTRIDQALDVVDGLLREAPEDAYFHELRGQILFENGRLKDALPAYERAVTLRPDQPLLRIGLAHVQIEIGGTGMIRKASSNLERSVRKERLMPRAWHLAAIAYGRSGRYGLSALAQAEGRILTGRKAEAAAHAKKAMRILEKGSPAWLRAQDILAVAAPERKAPEK